MIQIITKMETLDRTLYAQRIQDFLERNEWEGDVRAQFEEICMKTKNASIIICTLQFLENGKRYLVSAEKIGLDESFSDALRKLKIFVAKRR